MYRSYCQVHNLRPLANIILYMEDMKQALCKNQ
nr:MAG TPA: putative P4-specific DNA primase [Caudoviricetes sp.]